MQREPGAVLRTPEQVAEWIEARIIELGGTRQLRAIADGEWVQIGDADDLARLFGEHVAVACRGHSIYTDVYHPDQHIELFVEAVGRDVAVSTLGGPTVSEIFGPT